MGQLNIELFKKVRDRIATFPTSYYQRVWIVSCAESPCGAAACLAGETIICAAPTIEEGIAELFSMINQGSEFDIPNRAAALLGLSGNYEETDAGETIIFVGDASGWPEPYRSQFKRAKGNADEARAAVAFLDHIISTGKVLE